MTVTWVPIRDSAFWLVTSSTSDVTYPTRRLISASDNFSSKLKASVPSSSEYPKMPIASNSASLINSHKVSSSASLSPGNPTIKLERIPASGATLRIEAISSKNSCLPPNRRIFLKMVGAACWNERSKYGTTFSVLTIAFISCGRISAGCKYETRILSIFSILESAGKRASSKFMSPRSLPYEVVFSLTKNSSRTPRSLSHTASAIMSVGRLETNEPRKAGIAQNVHLRSQPFAIFKGAYGFESRRRRITSPELDDAISLSAGALGVESLRSIGTWLSIFAPPTIFASDSPMFSYSSNPSTASASGISAASSFP